MYEQIKKNTVKAEKQLPLDKHIVFEGSADAACRIAFVGNSITLHGEKPEVGWFHTYGMAASCKDNDYVHRVIREVRKNCGSVCACICNAYEWERSYKTEAAAVVPTYRRVRDFKPDIIILRFIENCSIDGFDADLFRHEYSYFVDYLAGSSAKLIFTTGFWKHPGDEAVIRVAEEKNSPCVYLGDLGEREDTKAIGLFENSGVANHPGDLGMQIIADRICKALQSILS